MYLWRPPMPQAATLASAPIITVTQSWPLRDIGSSNDRPGDQRRGESSPAPEDSRDPKARARRLGRVLIADDAWDAREMYALYFRSVGYDTVTAHDGPEAILIAQQTKPDVIIMDVSMPRMSGVTATRYLKNNARTRRIPVIILTGRAAQAIQEGALEMGADMFLTKPCLPEDLEQQVARLLRGLRAR